MLIKLKIQSYEDREKIVTALANSGISVKIIEEKDKIRIATTNYFVVFDYKDLSE